jgi:hypothetical protein
MATLGADLDHLVVAADTLEQGTAYLADCLGVAPIAGGRHAAMGTHNRVLDLGRERYLEVIAIDPEGRPPAYPRWFNLDDPGFRKQLTKRPRLVSWVARTDAIDQLARLAYGQPASIRPMRRGSLRWWFAFSDDGSVPGKGLLPHLIQWDEGDHPTDAMPASGCTLVKLAGTHSDPPALNQVISSLGLADVMTIRKAAKRQPPGVAAHIQTPAGMVILD